MTTEYSIRLEFFCIFIIPQFSLSLMSLSKVSCLSHFDSCLKSGGMLYKNTVQCKNQNVSKTQNVRVLVTCQSTNIRNISYALKTNDNKRKPSLEANYKPWRSSSPSKRHQSIALTGLQDQKENYDIDPKLTVTLENIKKKIIPFFSPFQKTRSGFKATAKPYHCIPGPRGIPVFGSALDYTVLGKFSPQEFHVALQNRHKKYGAIFREKIMGEEYVYVSNPNDIRMLAQNEGSAPCRPSLEVMVQSRTQEGLPVGITAMQGSEWLRNRIAINPVISLSKTVTKFRDAQRVVTKDFVKMMKQKQSSETFEVPNFEELTIRWALESIAVVLLDSRLGLLAPSSSKTNSAAEGLRRCMDVFFDYGARLTFSLPTWKIWNTKDWKIFRKAQADEFRFAGYFVEKKLKELCNEKSKKGQLLKTIPDGCPFHHGKKTTKTQDASCLLDHVINHSKLSKEEAVTVCLEMLAGGIDTTSTAAVFTLYHLATNPLHQEHLRSLLEEEASQCANEYSRETSKFTKYLKACVWEAMRLNPLTYANARTAQKELVLSGYSVPAGTQVRFTSHLMNLESEEYFPEPKKYIPERWLDRDSSYRCKKQFTFTPFGHGPRQCPGRRVAEQELDLFFREILSNFRVGYKYKKMGVKVRLFNGADEPAKFEFLPLTNTNEQKTRN